MGLYGFQEAAQKGNVISPFLRGVVPGGQGSIHDSSITTVALVILVEFCVSLVLRDILDVRFAGRYLLQRRCERLAEQEMTGRNFLRSQTEAPLSRLDSCQASDEPRPEEE